MTDAEPIVLDEPRALVVAEPVGLARAEDPEALIAMATKWADALKRVMENQKLYAVIRGKKYPQVEAWMTIGRMDNVVAAESRPPIRHEDGSYEAFVELLRLNDMAVIGRASALCGTVDDPPWHDRSEPARRSMAATRAVSRGFRMHYSWVMAMAGFEPTPADEMPQSGEVVEHRAADAKADNGIRTEPWLDISGARLEGRVGYGPNDPVDGNRRVGPDDMPRFGFRLVGVQGEPVRIGGDGPKLAQAVAEGPLADDLFDASEGGTAFDGRHVTVEGDVWRIPWQKGTKWMPAFCRMMLTRVSWTDADGVAVSLPAPREAESEPLGLDV
jgi:hypothetical protein